MARSTHRYEWSYVYGFAHPASGRSEWLILPTVNTRTMSRALALFAQATGAGPDKRVVLVLDNAGWHTSRALAIPDGLHLVYLPAQTPELQPAEHLWPLLNEAVANRSFADIAALDDRLEQRCRQLLAEPARIQAATRFHWWPTDHSGAS